MNKWSAALNNKWYVLLWCDFSGGFFFRPGLRTELTRPITRLQLHALAACHRPEYVAVRCDMAPCRMTNFLSGLSGIQHLQVPPWQDSQLPAKAHQYPIMTEEAFKSLLKTGKCSWTLALFPLLYVTGVDLETRSTLTRLQLHKHTGHLMCLWGAFFLFAFDWWLSPEYLYIK